ncbi:SycD/LcrH family type III secretion system chaperone [Sinorhizobium sp. 7-81]|uniref:SycD/LcrH family type III secretion system chaperone n=1 Tax=unclassified Sinorhizobium TaxID=2613772 RepID=UPI0024C3B533|nr:MULTISPECIES: SycD/LcrH family type III secretion system chaperone [unclassified Sinorhizobium]MDK1389330.1 SycD/LcrH family type III secretion system chaperone [Sinorhizobium sp. 7-81]MDK1492971.1 SycD/LcrH family type III secretion system chaperone [Sinorhizobium sp. 8-89]
MTMTEFNPLMAGDAADLAQAGQLAAELMAGRVDLAAIIGITDEEIEALYVLGHRYYSSGKYEEALNFFRFLCVHRHIDGRFWFGLAAASQMLGNAETAVHAYRLAALLNSEDPQIPLRAAECFIRLDRSAAAINALEGALALSAGKPEHAVFSRRALMMLDRLRSEAGTQEGDDA